MISTIGIKASQRHQQQPEKQENRQSLLLVIEGWTKHWLKDFYWSSIFLSTAFLKNYNREFYTQFALQLYFNHSMHHLNLRWSLNDSVASVNMIESTKVKFYSCTATCCVSLRIVALRGNIKCIDCP